jgi:hypothetical protein
MIRRFVKQVSGGAKAAAGAVAAATPVADQPANIPTATPVKSEQVPFVEQRIITRIQHIPAGVILNVLADIEVRYLLPGVGAGAGGELERTMKLQILHDEKNDKMLLHLPNTNAFFTVQFPAFNKLVDLLSVFFRNKPLTVTGTREPILDRLLEDLKTQSEYLQLDIRAY